MGGFSNALGALSNSTTATTSSNAVDPAYLKALPHRSANS